MDEEADRRARAGVGMAHAVGDRQHRLLAGQRLADDAGEKAGRRLVGFARPHADGRQANADAVEKAAARIVGEQQFADRLLGAVGGERRQMKIVRYRVGERRAEHRDRRGENHFRLVAAAGGADRFQQRAGAVEIDVVALLEIGFRFARHHAGEMEDHVRPACDRLRRGARGGQVAGCKLDGAGEAGGFFRRDHVDQRQPVDWFAR